MEIFHSKIIENAHDALQKWRSLNEDGFVLNWRSPNNFTLHRVHCPHLGDTYWEPAEGTKGWGDMGKTKKICSMNKQELEQYAREEGTVELKYCKRCAP